MNISLFYVQGISRMDEPVFDTIAHQRAFFVSKRVASLEQAFYPPHYQDRIKLEIGADISLNEAVNYLSLSFAGKEYYYFIDNLVYINEGVLEIGVTLDAIQTFMFNIHFINSDVSRKSIKRWNGSQINREYIRENAGEQMFVQQSYEEMPKFPYYGVLIKCTPSAPLYKFVQNATSRLFTFEEITTAGQSSAYGVISDPYVYFLLPMVVNKDEYVYLDGSTDSDFRTVEYMATKIAKLQQLDCVQEISIVSGLIFARLGINVTREVLETPQGAIGYRFTIGQSVAFPIIGKIDRQDTSTTVTEVTNIFTIGRRWLPVANTHYERSFGFTKNDQQGVTFSYIYCPQLLDENYFQLSWGEKMSYTSYPLHKLKTPSIFLHYQFVFGDNIRTYYVTDSPIGGSEKDVYLTLIQNRSIENLVLFNDAYREYLSQNYATLTRGVALAKQQNLYSFGMGFVDIASGLANSGAKLASGLATMVAGDGRGLSSVISGGMGIRESAINIGTHIADFVEKDYVIDEKVGITKDNLNFRPDTVKQGNSASADVLAAVLYPFAKIERDINIVHAAEVFESYGYKVHEVTEDNLFYLNLRYYYDVIQCDDMEIELTNYINDLSTINSIKARFNMGLRLWHTDNGVLRLDLGKVCYYDNVEQ